MDNTIILGVIISYISLLIVIGIYTSKKAKNSTSFFLADRSLNKYFIGATITATTVGGSATIVAGGRIYANGLPAIWYDLAGAFGLIVLGLFIANKVRKTGLFTLPDISGKIYDEKVRLASSILIIITEIAWVSLLIQAASLVLEVILPLEYEILLFAITAAFIIYTIIGGQYAVVYTDIIQFLVMLIGVVFIATPILFLDAQSGISQLSMNTLSFPINSNIGILAAGSIFFMMFMPHIVGPDIYSKILSARNEEEARKGTIISGVFKLIFAIAIALIAISALVLHPGLANPYIAIPTAVVSLSPILAGFILAAFLSVMISSADSCLLSAGTIISVDLLKNKNINISRIGILLIGIFALILALYLKDVLKTLELAYTIFTAGLTMPILFGFYKKKTHVTSKGALWSLILGGIISILWLNFMSDPYSEYAVLPGLFVSIIPLLIFRENKSISE